MSQIPDIAKIRTRIVWIGIGLSILILWNGVCDLIYGYSPNLSGLGYFSPAVVTMIQTADGRPHWMLLLGQTAGWLYPIFALGYYHWWFGMRRAGFWLGVLPVLLLVYALLMIGGIQHAGWAFLSVLEQAKAVVGSTEPQFFGLANRYILEHFFMGDLTAVLALYAGTILFGIAIVSGRTAYPRWFVLLSPFGVLTLNMVLGLLMPAPIAGLVLAPFGTWFMLIPNIAGALWMLKKIESDPKILADPA